jgi:hypothetical protein
LKCYFVSYPKITENDDASGKGNYIYLEAYTSSTTGLADGTYTYDADETYVSGTFDYGEVVVNYDIENETWDKGDIITAGTLTVTKNGSSYTIVFSGTTSDGGNVTASYTGSLTFYDYSSGKKSDSPKRWGYRNFIQKQ